MTQVLLDGSTMNIDCGNAEAIAIAVNEFGWTGDEDPERTEYLRAGAWDGTLDYGESDELEFVADQATRDCGLWWEESYLWGAAK